MTANANNFSNAKPLENYYSNPPSLETHMDSTGVSTSIENTNAIDNISINHSIQNDQKESKKNGVFDSGFSFVDTMVGDGSQLDEDNTYSKGGKRSNIETNFEMQNEHNSRLRRPRRFSKASSESSTSTSNLDVVVSSLTKRLTQMAVKERQSAMYDLHGIPLDDECPQKMQKLLSELDQMIEERLQFSKSSYADGDDFGEPDLFPLLTKEQQNELMSPPKTIATENNRLENNFNKDGGDSQSPAILQRVRFLKHNLDDKEFGEGLRLARKQSPEYVHAQRIKFLRADRYDVSLASARMIRFFDIKRELFCHPGYNGNDRNDRLGCLGRDLSLSDFSKDDLELWGRTGFIQLCGMRDRAKRPIVTMFGKIILEAKITSALLLRVYLYVCNLWSRDESTQRAGIVVIAYNMFSDPSSCQQSASTTEGRENGVDEEVIKQYLKQTYPFSSEMIKVGMAAQLRSVSIHFCIDHHILNSQYEKIAGYMSTATVARLRCHYASAKNPESSILGASGMSKIKSTSNSPNYKDNNAVYKSDHDTVSEISSRHGDDKDNISTVNPHSEVLYKLMTFGIPRETIPINDTTGEIQLELHRAILKAIGEREDQDRSIEANKTSPFSAPMGPSATSVPLGKSTEGSAGTDNKNMIGITSSTVSDRLWMSLMASTGSNTSFALFPNLLEDDQLKDGSDHSTRSLLGSPLSGKSPSSLKMENPLPDLSSSLSANSASMSTYGGHWESKPAAPVTSVASELPNRTEERPPTLSVPKVIPAPNDVIMGRGPWNRNHPGNLQLKAMLERERDRYERVNRFERMQIVDAMLNELYNDLGARFLYKPKPQQTKGGEACDDVWLEAKRDKAHDKITHDFRNLRRQKQVPSK
eukprot:CAMPEP_0116152942 /NCGR_PEP_ID=MMETSP0329-20121206/20955_1 /TAXON_ID=697910 /ORGANISM="Pseudo-nitzschia arenysensis, Strain B593" /LENGTH=870 /DNA_ID=CAMNT_0003649767 /DNA_START=126 /DNA_END=2738 /DNA_ORIENTATION=+